MSAVLATSATTITGTKQPLGTVLLEKGIVSHDQLRIALIEQKKRNVPLGKILVSLGFVSEATIRDILSETWARSRLIFPPPWPIPVRWR